MSAEIKELFTNEAAYTSSSQVSEWLNCSAATSLLFTVFSSSSYEVKTQWAIDNNFEVIQTNVTLHDGNTGNELFTPIKTRFVRFSVLSLTPPSILRTQGFFFNSNMGNSSGENPVTVKNIPISAFGSLKTADEYPKIQYVFSRGTTGSISGGTFALPYSEIHASDSGTNGIVSSGGGLVGLTGNLTGEHTTLEGGSVKYKSGVGYIARWTTKFFQGAKQSPNTGCTFQFIGCGNLDAFDKILNGFGVGFGDNSLPYGSDAFGVIYFRNGVKTFISRENLNRDKIDGLGLQVLDFTKINVFQLSMQYLGGGSVTISMENKNTGLLSPIHVFENAGTLTSTTLTDPSLHPLLFQHPETGFSEPITGNDSIECGSFMIGHEGIVIHPLDKFSDDNTVTLSSEQSVLSLRCDPTFYGTKNNDGVDPEFISVATDGTKNVTIRLYVNCNLAGSVWVNNYPNLIPASIDKTGTFSGLGSGREIFSFVMSKAESVSINITPYHLHLNPSDVLTVTAQSASNTDCTSSLTYHTV